MFGYLRHVHETEDERWSFILLLGFIIFLTQSRIMVNVAERLLSDLGCEWWKLGGNQEKLVLNRN